MLRDLMRDYRCNWCGDDLGQSFLTQLAAVEQNDTVLYPVICRCGGITPIGGGTFTDDRSGPPSRLSAGRHRDPEQNAAPEGEGQPECETTVEEHRHEQRTSME
jgi:hypothetical protein